MCEERRALLRSLEGIVESVPIDRLSANEAAEWVEFFSKVERLGNYGSAMCAGQMAEMRHQLGKQSLPEWLARERGESVARVRKMVKTAERLRSLPATREAFMCGALSATQVTDVARGASLDPSKEPELLHAAYSGSVPTLQGQVGRIVEEASRPKTDAEADARARSSHFRRSLRFWGDADGGCRFSGRLGPEEGRAFQRTVQEEARRMVSIARPRARLADALSQIVKERGLARRRTRSLAIVRVDLATLRRGRVEGDEICEVPGVGPIPVRTALELLGESTAYLLVTNGVDVTTMCHLGDGLPVEMEITMEERDSRCIVPGCLQTQHLAAVRWRTSGPPGSPAVLHDFCRLCRTHLYFFEKHRWQVTGGPGSWGFEPPADDGPDPPGTLRSREARPVPP